MKMGDIFNKLSDKSDSIFEALSYVLPDLLSDALSNKSSSKSSSKSSKESPSKSSSNDESPKEYCPNCHVPCIHKSFYWECPFCEYNIDDWESEEGIGYSTIEAARNAEFDEYDKYYLMYPHRNQYCPDCHVLCVREDDMFTCPTCDYTIDDSEIEDGEGYPTLASTYEDRDEEDEYPLPDDYEPEEDMPECCIACGGPYPQCTTSCKIFDD